MLSETKGRGRAESDSYHFCFLCLADLMGIYLTVTGGSWEVPPRLRFVTALSVSVSPSSPNMCSISQESLVMERSPGEAGKRLICHSGE